MGILILAVVLGVICFAWAIWTLFQDPEDDENDNDFF